VHRPSLVHIAGKALPSASGFRVARAASYRLPLKQGLIDVFIAWKLTCGNYQSVDKLSQLTVTCALS
jgi:hypothetical protein